MDRTLARDACLDLLDGSRVGRIGYSRGALPAVHPVAYRLVGDEVHVRVPCDSPLERNVRDAVVTFEVDHVDANGDGWVVSITGVAQCLAGDACADDGPCRADDGWSHVLAIPTDHLVGQAFSGGGLATRASNPEAMPG